VAGLLAIIGMIYRTEVFFLVFSGISGLVLIVVIYGE